MSFISDEEFNSRLESAYENELMHEEYALNRILIINEQFIRENVSDFDDRDYDNLPDETDRSLKRLYRKSNKLDRVQQRKATRTINRKRRRQVKTYRNTEIREQEKLQLIYEQLIEKEEDKLKHIEIQR